MSRPTPKPTRGPDSRTLAQTVEDRIREAILSGELPRGQPLRQAELAARFGVSPIPLREALRRLEAAGFVTLYPYRGAVVAAPSPEELHEMAEIFTALQAMALRRGVPDMSAQTLNQAAKVLDAMRAESDPERWGALNVEFHVTLCAAAGRPRLLEMVRSLVVNFSRYRRLALDRTQYRHQAETRNAELLAACRRGDGGEAVRILEEHVTSACDEIARSLPPASARRTSSGRGR